MSHSPEPEDVRLRFGMDPPRLEEQRHWEELVPGADEFHTFEIRDGVPYYMGQPEPGWRVPSDQELADDADGDA